MNNIRITAIGEILYDVYPDQKRLGGAPFNFIYHVWKFLGKANFISSVGNDDNGKELLHYLSSIGFNTKNILTDNLHPTGTVKVTIGADKSPKFFISSECSFDHLKTGESEIQVIANETDLLYFGTFTTRSGDSRKTLESILLTPEIKFFCDFNLRHDFYSKEFIEKALNACSVIKINDEEFHKLKEFFGLDADNDKAPGQLINSFGIDLIGLTLGAGGSCLYNRIEKNYFPSSSAEVKDTLGAGDAFSAMLAVGYMLGWNIEKINRNASAFAGEICKISGALPEKDFVYEKFREIINAEK